MTLVPASLVMVRRPTFGVLTPSVVSPAQAEFATPTNPTLETPTPIVDANSPVLLPTPTNPVS
ncbi:MAG: hypothetical protein VX910_01140 [Candidatus Latescibacterota bacterium]|nr:hypothetical protein [Candidatus Latescibacterota bacterium]